VHSHFLFRKEKGLRVAFLSIHALGYHHIVKEYQQADVLWTNTNYDYTQDTCSTKPLHAE